MSEFLEGVTFEGRPLLEVISEKIGEEIEEVRTSTIWEVSGLGRVRTSKIGKVGGKPSQRKHPVIAMSPEVVAHLNYLNAKGGNEAVGKFLNGSNVIQEANGSIETALNDAQEKVMFYLREAARNDAEGQRWARAVANLKETLSIVTGKAVDVDITDPVKVKKTKSKRSPSAGALEWKGLFTEVSHSGNKTFTRGDLLTFLRTKFGKNVNVGPAYAAIANAIKTGTITYDASKTNMTYKPVQMSLASNQ